MSRVTVLLADDHEIVRQGMISLLESVPGLEVVGEAGNGRDAIELSERLKPDVLIVDLIMPGLNGLEVIRQVCHHCPKTRVIALSMHANEAYVLEAIRNGASGYVLKGSQAADLPEAVRQVLAGGHYLSPPLTECAVEAYLEKARSAPLDLYDTLTSREREILQLAAEGQSISEIAERLSISPRTAEAHRGRVMQKLGLRSQTALVRYAFRRGILTIEGG